MSLLKHVFLLPPMAMVAALAEAADTAVAEAALCRFH